MPVNYDEICWLELTTVAANIRSKAYSSVELTQAMLSRVEAHDSKFHSYALLTPELALKQAAQADDKLASGQSCGPMHGVPIALKDLCDTAGEITTGGMWIHRDRVPTADATVVTRLREAGAVLLGKLQMTEGAFSAHHPKTPMPINPWGKDLWPGVSSSGSGVATATGLTFGSLGSDTLGSIRFPCSVNGVTGLKPTWGRVSRAGVMDLAPSMDHVGPIARSARDCAAMMNAIAGADPADPTSAQVAVPDYLAELQSGASLSGVTIGLDRALIEQFAEPVVAKTAFEAAEVLASLGAKIVSISLPDMTQIVQDSLQLAIAETAVTHEQTYPAMADDYGPVLSGLIENGYKVSASDLLKIGYRREAFVGQVSALMRTTDLILLPGMNVAGPTNEELVKQNTDLSARLARLMFTSPIDMSRQPSLTLPGGATESGAPIAFQLIGRAFDEALTLRAGHAYQQATEWHRRHPAMTAA